MSSIIRIFIFCTQTFIIEKSMGINTIIQNHHLVCNKYAERREKAGYIFIFLCLFVINLIEFISNRLRFRSFIPTFAGK
ncbi:hypothetical protein BFAG_03677 [Bacteroides fragilis 3_1_12]|uniref:Uncharacterized protein n=1 Tax=Bacteroides fragilis 3_1_12 TaxID=457424 RepID=A0ABN0BQ28_BACFG|nr:hypothetical protein BFAG_03677 [Bacteroides fragilis 3_1_12]